MRGDSGQVGDVVLSGHGDGAEEESGEGGVSVEDSAALGVDVEEVEFAGAGGELGFDAAEEEFEDRGLEGVKEEGYAGGTGEVVGEGVLLEEAGGGEGWSGGIGGVGVEPVVEVGLSDIGEGGVELDADDLAEGELAGDEHGTAFASTEVDEGVFGGGMGRVGGLPEIDQGAQDAGSDAVVGGDVLVVGVAGGEASSRDETAGFDSVSGVEGMDGRVDGV